jgi:2'-5' RNA ligase
MQYRYYIGLSLPSPLRELITTAQTEQFDPFTVIPPLEPHITLLPPPDVEHIPPSALAPDIKKLAAPYLPLEITLVRIETFGGRTVAIQVYSPEIHALHHALNQLLAAKISRSRVRPFHPHITLNQAIRGQKLPENLVQKYTSKLGPLLPTDCRIDHLTLYHWQKPRIYRADTL